MRRLQQQRGARLPLDGDSDGVDGALKLVREIHSDVAAMRLQLTLTTPPRAVIAPNYTLVILSALAVVGFTSALLLLNTETTRIVAAIGLCCSMIAAGAVLLASGWLRVGQDDAVLYSQR